jgi:NitT/TauT family transport system substrate-binding protein
VIPRFGVVLAAALALALPAAAQQKMDKVSVGLVITLSQSPFYVAEEKGYLADEHIAVEEANFAGAGEMISALATGKLDISMGALNAGFFNAANQGLDMRIVAALGAQPAPVGSTPLLARKDLWDSGAIKSGKDLKGRIVAANLPGAIPEYLLTLVLAKYGMGLKDVHETMLPFPQMLIAFKNKAIDAGFPAEPLATQAIREGFAELVVPEESVGNGDLTTVAFFSGQFMRQRTDVAVRFLRALVRGAHDTQGAYNKDPAMAALLAKASKLNQQSIENAVAFAFDPNLDIDKYIDSLRHQEAVHMQNGRLNYTTPLDLAKVVDASLVHKAAASIK